MTSPCRRPGSLVGIARRDRDLAGAQAVARVVAGPARRKRPAPVGAAVGRRAVHDHRLEDQAVARLHGEADDAVFVPFRLDIGQRRQPGVGIGPPVGEVVGAEGRPGVGTRDVCDAGLLGHRVERQPDRADLPPGHRPVGLVLVPGRAFGRARLLHQKLVVEEVDLARPHDAPGDLRRWRFHHETPERRMALPQVEIAEEAPCPLCVFLGMGARMRHRHLDRLA